MNYNDKYEDDIEAAVGANQLNSVEDDITDALNGDFDDILAMNDDDIDTMMDAGDDLAEMGGLPDSDADFARQIVADCNGTDEEGDAKAAVSVMLEMVAPLAETRRVMAQQAMYRPIVYINKRVEFIEVILKFPTELDANLRVLLANLDKYSDALNKTDELSVEVPYFTVVLFPLRSLGTYYMSLANPVMWALTTEKVGAPTDMLKLVFKCDDVGFYQTDEIDMADIQSAIQREEQAELEARAEMEEKDQRKREHEAEMEELRQSLNDNE